MCLQLQQGGIGGSECRAQILGEDVGQVVRVGRPFGEEIVPPSPEIHGAEDGEEREARNRDRDDAAFEVVERATGGTRLTDHSAGFAVAELTVLFGVHRRCRS